MSLSALERKALLVRRGFDHRNCLDQQCFEQHMAEADSPTALQLLVTTLLCVWMLVLIFHPLRQRWKSFLNGYRALNAGVVPPAWRLSVLADHESINVTDGQQWPGANREFVVPVAMAAGAVLLILTLDADALTDRPLPVLLLIVCPLVLAMLVWSNEERSQWRIYPEQSGWATWVVRLLWLAPAVSAAVLFYSPAVNGIDRLFVGSIAPRAADAPTYPGLIWDYPNGYYAGAVAWLSAVLHTHRLDALQFALSDHTRILSLDDLLTLSANFSSVNFDSEANHYQHVEVAGFRLDCFSEALGQPHWLFHIRDFSSLSQPIGKVCQLRTSSAQSARVLLVVESANVQGQKGASLVGTLRPLPSYATRKAGVPDGFNRYHCQDKRHAADQSHDCECYFPFVLETRESKQPSWRLVLILVFAAVSAVFAGLGLVLAARLDNSDSMRLAVHPMCGFLTRNTSGHEKSEQLWLSTGELLDCFKCIGAQIQRAIVASSTSAGRFSWHLPSQDGATGELTEFYLTEDWVVCLQPLQLVSLRIPIAAKALVFEGNDNSPMLDAAYLQLTNPQYECSRILLPLVFVPGSDSNGGEREPVANRMLPFIQRRLGAHRQTAVHFQDSLNRLAVSHRIALNLISEEAALEADLIRAVVSYFEIYESVRDIKRIAEDSVLPAMAAILNALQCLHTYCRNSRPSVDASVGKSTAESEIHSGHLVPPSTAPPRPTRSQLLFLRAKFLDRLAGGKSSSGAVASSASASTSASALPPASVAPPISELKRPEWNEPRFTKPTSLSVDSFAVESDRRKCDRILDCAAHNGALIEALSVCRTVVDSVACDVVFVRVRALLQARDMDDLRWSLLDEELLESPTRPKPEFKDPSSSDTMLLLQYDWFRQFPAEDTLMRCHDRWQQHQQEKEFQVQALQALTTAAKQSGGRQRHHGPELDPFIAQIIVQFLHCSSFAAAF